MLGAIIGDVVGSRFEFNNIKTKDFKLLDEHSTFTDDTVLTIAVMDWLLHAEERNDCQIPSKMGEEISSCRLWGNVLSLERP